METVVQTGYPDQVLFIGRVTLGEQARKAMKQKQEKERQREAILRAACALLNTGGGVIRMEADDQHYRYSTDSLGPDLESALAELISPAHINDFFCFFQKGTEFRIYVKSWCSSNNRARICSISTGLRRRSETSVLQVASSAICEVFQRRRKKVSENNKIYQFYERNRVNLNEVLEFGEGVTVDFKDFSSQKLLVRLRECLPRYMSAFANTAGGFLFIGVDDRRRVTGCGRGEDKERLRERVEEICGKAIARHRPSCSNRDGDSWSVEHRFIEVLDGNMSENTTNSMAESMMESMMENITENTTESKAYVLAIKIPVFCCAVFEKDPDSWQIKDSELCRFTAEEWLGMMEITDPVEELTRQFEMQLTLSDAPPQCRRVYGLQHLKRLQARLFPVDEDDISTGPVRLREGLFREYENLRNLETLERPEDAPGVLIFSRSWAVDIGRVGNGRVICDALLICQNSWPCLYTVVEEGSLDLWEYAASTALHLKQKLVNVGGYSDRICVVPKLVNCQTGKLIPREQNSPDGGVGMLYPDCYQLGSEGEVESVLCSLVIVLLNFTSALSDELGCEFLNLLTEEQFQFLQNYKDIKQLFIHGLPGSGKTVLAAEKMKRLKNAFNCKEENILYICENQPLKCFMSKKKICLCETRTGFMMRSEWFSEVKHIIVDEGQNFRVEDGDWFQKARNIVGQTGHLWVFLDHFQQSHTFPSGLPSLPEQDKAYLHTVVRNSKQVSERLKKEIDDICQSSTQHHLKEMGSKLCFASSFPGSYEEQKMAEGEVVPYLRRTLNHLLHGGWSPKDIAILCSTEKESSQCTRDLESKRVERGFWFTTALDMDSDAVVVDSIRRFSGLERNVVILVHPRAHPSQSQIQLNLLAAAISRARIRLIVMSRGTGTDRSVSQFQGGKQEEAMKNSLKRRFI